MNSSIVYDVETQRTFAEVGDRIDQLRVSFLGLYAYSQDKFFSFFERDLSKLETILQRERPTIIGFNSISFDNRVVQPYFQNLAIADLPQVDILHDIHRTLGFRLKLESVAQATLGEGKSGTGLDAIRYFREGDWKNLARYCLDDVRITRDLYNYGCAHGFILFMSGGLSQRIPVRWSTQPTITERLTQALQQHVSIQLQYIQLTDTSRTVTTSMIDVYSISDKHIEVFCHTRNTRWRYDIERIISVTPTGHGFSYQATLL
ncbi:MAG: ribonuclease H-like domain-containing protein [Candidatus Kerfeldbacteria bacterium]|nr:ribonuclease H-like domain-containing protein [Candidatus Kerfeldbacteria bacterium]